jgi:GT2 family glycosyltransferase
VCLLLDVARASAIGGFDDAYFLGKDDGEFCYRLRVAGWQIREVPRATVRHASRPRSTWLLPFQIRNRWHFILKNYETRTLLALAPALLAHEVAQLALLLAKGEGRAWWTALRQIGPMCATLPRQRAAVAGFRRVPDIDLLAAAPFLVRADFAGGRFGGLAKRLYDGWLAVYWRLVCRILR